MKRHIMQTDRKPTSINERKRCVVKGTEKGTRRKGGAKRKTSNGRQTASGKAKQNKARARVTTQQSPARNKAQEIHTRRLPLTVHYPRSHERTPVTPPPSTSLLLVGD